MGWVIEGEVLIEGPEVLIDRIGWVIEGGGGGVADSCRTLMI